MKKFIALLCLTALLTGCGNTEDSSSSSSQQEEVTETTSVTTAEAATEPMTSPAIAVSSMEDAYRKVLDEAKNEGFETFSLFGTADGQEMLAVRLKNDSGTTVRLYGYQQISGTAVLMGEFSDTVRFYSGSELVHVSVYDADSRIQTDTFYSVSDNTLVSEKELGQTFSGGGIAYFIDGSEIPEDEFDSESEALQGRPGIALGGDFSIDDDVISVVFNKNVNWQDAYSTYLLSCLDNANGAFSLLDINGDSVPELFYSTGDGHVDYVRVFSLKDGLRGLGGYGTYGKATFYPDTEELLSSDTGMGYFSGSYYKLGRDVRFTETLSFGDNSALDSNADEIVFTLNGQTVDEKTYRDELARRNTTSYFLGRDNALTAESAKALANEDYDPPVLEDLQPVQNLGNVSENYKNIISTFYNSGKLEMSHINSLEEPDQISHHTFAIYDLNGDGRDELIIKVNSTYAAEIGTFIYSEDDNGDLVFQYTRSTNMVFYDNGDMDELNMFYVGNGKAGRFTPYVLYTYDASDGKSLFCKSADGWDKQVYPDGFPEDADKDGDGMVYILSSLPDDKGYYMDYDEFQSQVKELHGGAGVIELPFRNFTEENVNAVS